MAMCTQHGSCYTQNSLDSHLALLHKVPRKRRVELLFKLRQDGLAMGREDVPLPQDGSVALPGLPVLYGYRCSEPSCRFISTGSKNVAQHCRTQHGQSSGVKGRRRKQELPPSSSSTSSSSHSSSSPYSPVTVQTLWSKKQHIYYFVVQESLQDQAAPELDSQKDLWTDIEARYKAAQDQQARRQTTLLEPVEHVSELTPWLKGTGYASHLEGLPLDQIPQAYQLPDKGDERELAAICASVARLLTKGMAILSNDDGAEERQLSKVNAKLLNTFRGAEMSQDPIKPLQNRQSRQKYIQTWQKLVCYFYRVTQDKHLHKEGRPPFQATQEQLSSTTAAWEQAEQVCLREENEKEGEEEEGEEDYHSLDQATLDLGIYLIQHPLDKRAFDSAMVSFAAMLAWDSTKKTWMVVNNYTSFLSQIIFDSQLLVLLYCLDLADSGEASSLTSCLREERDKWLLNDTSGPIAELSASRLLGFTIGKATVNQAQVRWHTDEETVVFQEVQLHMDQLKELVGYNLQGARVILEQDLCFGIGDIPNYQASDLVDNWDAAFPGQSFLTDTRNSSYLAAGQSWLLNQLRLKPEVLKLLCRSRGTGATPTSPWKLSTTAVTAYEDAVQHFLEHLMVLLHITSGQPARRPEFLGLRWCNKQADKRNIFVHDGYLLFLLSYHKSLNMTNSSRFPVRFLLHQVEELLLQYLILILPFRIWLSAETGVPECVSEYLWHNGNAVWTEDKMTSVLVAHSTQAIGVRLNIQGWRQIAIGIAIKKFSRQGLQLDLDIPADGNTGPESEGVSNGRDNSGGSMPEAFHWQASHNPRTGNAVYGGTVNFRQGLTDAGLQEYLATSKMWHSLFQELDATSNTARGSKHARQESRGEHRPNLAKRLAFRGDIQQGCQRIWSAEQALNVLQQMHGQNAVYNSHQGKAIQAVISNRLQVVAVLATGHGKSLLYQLPARLPGAGTTLLIVPLVALKQDTVQKCKQLGVDCTVWSSEQPPGPGCPLVLVSLDQAVQTPFLTFANQLDVAGLLARVVIDESHLVCTAESYREKMREVKQLRMLHCQFVLLTATLPPTMESAFEEALLLQRPLYIRSATIRTDLEYHVVKVVQTSQTPWFELAAASLLQATLQEDWFVNEGAQARALVFVRTRAQADVVAEYLGCSKYYSDSGTEEEKAAVLTQWIEGKPAILVATSALAGVDYRHVRAVFHIGEPSGGAIDFAQDIGRAGRDGQGGLSVTFLPTKWQAQYNTDAGALLPRSVKAMQRYLDTPRCRMIPLSQYLDGEAQSCQNTVTACDRCTSLGLLPSTLGSQDQDSGSDTDSSEKEPDPGSLLIQQHNSQTAQQLQHFTHGLDLLQGCCILCRFLDNKRGEDAEHSLDQCRSRFRREFLDAKKTAVQQGRSSGSGWLARYGACYRCGNMQAVCSSQGQGNCKYKDLIMPLCWSVLHRGDWAAKVFRGLPQGLAASRDRDQYMFWLGERAIVFGEQGTNLALIADRVIQEVLLIA